MAQAADARASPGFSRVSCAPPGAIPRDRKWLLLIFTCLFVSLKSGATGLSTPHPTTPPARKLGPSQHPLPRAGFLTWLSPCPFDLLLS